MVFAASILYGITRPIFNVHYSGNRRALHVGPLFLHGEGVGGKIADGQPFGQALSKNTSHFKLWGRVLNRSTFVGQGSVEDGDSVATMLH